MKKMIKKIIFVAVIAILILATTIVVKTGKFEKLEGYMYSLAAEITGTATNPNATDANATDSNATSSNALECATGSNVGSCATSSNAAGCATSGNATDTNATSSNAQITETIIVTNTSVNEEIENVEPEETVEIDDTDTIEIVSYNSSEITSNIIKEIEKNARRQEITINLDSVNIISENLFKAIQGKDVKLIINSGENKIIFKGNDILSPKDIDANISYNLVKNDNLLGDIVSNGIIINFADNGKLPGIATVKIKVNSEISKELDLDTIYVYHYDEELKELIQLENNAIYNEDGFIEFEIKHNSKYLFVDEIIEEKEYVVTTGSVDAKEKVSFLESHKMYIIIIGVSILAIIIVIIILIIDKRGIAKRKANFNNKEN